MYGWVSSVFLLVNYFQYANSIELMTGGLFENVIGSSKPIICPFTSFLNYVSFSGSPTYCVINRVKDASKHGKCVRLDDLWMTFYTSSSQQRRETFVEPHQWLSLYEYMMTGEYDNAFSNRWGQLNNAQSVKSLSVSHSRGLSVSEFDSMPPTLQIPLSTPLQFAQPYSICKALLINSHFDLTRNTTIIRDCPNVTAQCRENEPEPPNRDGVYYYGKYEGQKATKCWIKSLTPNKCVTIDDAIELIKHYNGTIGNVFKNYFSEAYRWTYDGVIESFQKLASTKGIVEALNTFKNVLGLKEKRQLTINFGSQNVTIGEIAFCSIISMQLPLSDEQFGDKLIDC